MNILLVTDASLVRGGISLFMLQWINGIKKAYEKSIIHVYFRDHVDDPDLKKQYEALGVRIYTGNIPRSIKFGVPFARKKVKDDIRKIIKEADIDIIHINSGIFGYNLDLLAESKHLGVKVRVSHSHGAYPERFRDKVVHFFVKIGIRYYATAYAGCSKQAGVYLFGKRAILSKKWTFIPNAINTERFMFDETRRLSVRNSLNVTDDELLLGAVGLLNAGKNHMFLLDILADLKAKDLSAKLIIVGKGEMEGKIREKMRKLGIEDQVILYGPSDDVPSLLSAMDIYLMPSESEGLGISAVEAQANGLPCILSDRFPEEVIMSDKVWCLPIDQGVGPWIGKIIQNTNCQTIDRKAGVAHVKMAGFDQGEMQKYVSNLYNMGKNCIVK